MIRFLLRVVSLVLLAGAFASAVVDGARSIAADAILLTPFSATCLYLFPERFPLLQPYVRRHLAAWVWNPALADLFSLPTWLVLCALGAACLWISRKRAPPIGYSSRP